MSMDGSGPRGSVCYIAGANGCRCLVPCALCLVPKTRGGSLQIGCLPSPIPKSNTVSHALPPCIVVHVVHPSCVLSPKISISIGRLMMGTRTCSSSLADAELHGQVTSVNVVPSRGSSLPTEPFFASMMFEFEVVRCTAFGNQNFKLSQVR